GSPGETPFAEHPRGAEGHHRVAVHDLASLVDDDHAVGIAVERDADRRLLALHFLHHVLRMERAAPAVDVAPVRTATEARDLRAELSEDLRRATIRGAVSSVDDDAYAVQRQIFRKRALREHDVAPGRVFEPLCAAHAG